MKAVYIKDILLIDNDEIEQLLDGQYIKTGEIRKMDKYSAISLAAARKIYSINYGTDIEKINTSVITTTCYGATTTVEDSVDRYLKNSMVSPIFITKILSNMQAAAISIALGLKGRSYNISTRENSMADAIIDVYENIRHDEEMRSIVIASDYSINEYGKNLQLNCSSVKELDRNVIYAVAVLLDSIDTGSQLEIEAVYHGVLDDDSSSCLFINKYKFENLSYDHGIYFPEIQYILIPQRLFGAGRTGADIYQGAKLCRTRKLSKFTVFSIVKNKYYSAIDIKYHEDIDK